MKKKKSVIKSIAIVTPNGKVLGKVKLRLKDGVFYSLKDKVGK